MPKQFDEITAAVGNTVLARMFKELAQFLGKKLDAITVLLNRQQSPVDNRPVVSAIQRLGSFKDISVAVTTDTTELEEEVRKTNQTLKSYKTPDLKRIETLLSNLLVATSNSAKEMKQMMEGMPKPTETKFPDKMKVEIDDMQLRSIRSGSMPLNPAPLAPRNVTLANVSATTANTQYSYALPAGTTEFFIKLRAQNVLMYLAWVTGKLPTAGDGTAYYTISQNGYRSASGLDIGGKTIYFSTPSATQVVEIESYQA